MKIKNLLIIASFIFCAISVNGQTKVGTVNVNDILTKLPELSEVSNSITAYQNDLEKKLNEKIRFYKTKGETYTKNVSTYTDVMKKTLSEELYALEEDIKKFQQNGVKLSQIKKDELLRPLYKKISDMIEVVAKEQNYTQIMTLDGNEFAYADVNHDITNTVKTRLGIKD